MTYKSIFIANLAEIALDLTRTMGKTQAETEIWEDHALCDRFIFFKNDDKILITPFLLDPIFFKDSCLLMRFKNIVNFAPENSQPSLCESILADKKLLSKLKELLSVNPEIKLYSYAATKEFFHLAEVLKVTNLPEAPRLENRWTQEFFGSKAGFRQAAAVLGSNFPKMPEGAICTSNDELKGWATYFSDTGYVQKHNHGLAGAGLKIVKSKDVKTTSINENTWPVVIERYIDPDLTVCGGAPNVELKIEDGKVIPSYVCSMRVTPEGVFQGIEIGNGAVSEKPANELLSAGRLWGEYLAKRGYNGYFEIDFVAGIDKKIYPIEANLRRTGGTHVYETALRLLGKQWSDNYIVARNIFATKFRNYGELKQATKNLFYKNGEGLIITVANYLVKNKLGYIVIGKTQKRALEIEKKFHESCLSTSP